MPVLEVTILGAAVHGSQTAHATVDLELTTLVDFHIARAFLTASQQRAQHDYVAAGGDGLSDVARVLDAAVSDDGDAVLGSHAGGVIYSGDLGHADTGDHTGGADGAGADADLHAVGACLR